MQQPHQQAALQHLAHLRQEDSDRARQALEVVQALERQRLGLEREDLARHQLALAEAVLEAHLVRNNK